MKITKEGFAVLEADTHLSRWVEDQGKLCQDEAVAKFILPHIKPGDTVIDGGAALGDHTCAYLDAVGPTGSVIAFEPNPKLFECLKWNCPLAVCMPIALWSNKVTLGFVEDPNAGAGYVCRSADNTVVAMPLDAFHLPRVNLIKLDVEGAEAKALTGAALTIAMHRPKLVIEMNRHTLKRMDSTFEEVLHFLRDRHYALSSLQPGAPNADPDQYDLLALPS